MAKDNLSRSAEAQLTDLLATFEERLLEFKTLRDAKRYAGAVYLGRYVIEILLKCSICKRLGKSELPTIFHSHDLNKLIYYTGLEDDLKANSEMYEGFKWIYGQSVDELRYQNPAKVTETDCLQWDMWLNNSAKGLVPWFREKLK